MQIILSKTRKRTVKILLAISLIALTFAIGISIYKSLTGKTTYYGQKILSQYSYETKQITISRLILATQADEGNLNNGTVNSVIAKFDAQIADTESKRALGLSFRKSMSFTTHPISQDSMFFIFPQDIGGGFWMKDMNFNLDIIFVDSSYNIIKIFKNLPPCPKDLNNCSSYAPYQPYRYVLEVNGGTSDNLGIKEGDVMKITN